MTTPVPFGVPKLTDLQPAQQVQALVKFVRMFVDKLPLTMAVDVNSAGDAQITLTTPGSRELAG